MLSVIIRNFAGSVGLPWPLRWKLSWAESLLLVPTFLLAAAFEFFGDNFGKKGIPFSLPGAFGSIPNFEPKLFPMELYLLWVGLLTLLSWRRWEVRNLARPLILFTVLILVFGLARAVPDLRFNPMLVIRNSAFVWYLALPLMIVIYPMPSLRWESFFRLLYVVSFAYFMVNLAYPIYDGDPSKIFWSINMGLLLALAYGFCSLERWTARIALSCIGFVVGLSLFGSLQRTTLIGLIMTGLLLICSSLFLTGIFPKPRWRRAIWLAIGLTMSVGCVFALRFPAETPLVSGSTAKVPGTADPFKGAETTSAGLEKFRYFMWTDAWNLFKDSPLTGIGFLRPVVFRAYYGLNEFYDNNQGSFEQRSQKNYHKSSPPISGPHNSYLNAITRLGVFGASFLFLHLASAWFFFTRCYFACFFVTMWQMLYACFNVSLEGPIRSFPLLVLIGVALKLVAERSRPGKSDYLLRGAKRVPAFQFRARQGEARRMGLVHVSYRFYGGEDHHVSVLRETYRSLGFEPISIPAEGTSSDLLISAARSLTLGSPSEWDQLMRSQRIEFLHLNNIHANLGPAFLRWIISRGVPTLMTVHNHRFYCTNGLALYGSEVCKSCRPGPNLLRPIVWNCNGSLPKSVYHAAAMTEIRGEDLLSRAVSSFLAPSPYIARELQIAGISPRMIQNFPHAVDVQGAAISLVKPTDVAFVGRLSPEKGVAYLLEAAALLPHVSFSIVGEGPLEARVRRVSGASKNIHYLGKLPQPEALAVMRDAKVVCVPSVCHESFSLVAAEALSLGCRLVVPDTQSFHHYTLAPYSAVPAIMTNPESLAYSITTALEQPKRSAEETARIRQRFGIEGFRERLRVAVDELTSQRAERSGQSGESDRTASPA